MVKGLYTAYTGMLNQQYRMDVLTNNLANVTTTGYKKEGATGQAFNEMMADKIDDLTDKDPRRLGHVSLGVKIGETYTDYSQGAFRVTDNDLDLAFDGDGFFAISYTSKAGETSVKYTRDGAFSMLQDGTLVTKDGDYLLSDSNNPTSYIRIDPAVDFTVDYTGAIWQNEQIVGNIDLVDFENYDFLEKFGENLYQPVDGAVKTASNARIEQGVLEMSNVNSVYEMVEMISVSRAYEANQKVIQAIDNDLDKAANQLGKIG